MEKPKVIRDSIHGYIEIEPKYMPIIDSLLFQRLRRIEQTSYRVIYPSARHDRFIHSIGTFYLGKKAFLNFWENIQEDEPEIARDLTEEFWKRCEISFSIACLLHDIGHAPFSHTCENFFAQKRIEYNNSTIPFIEKKLYEVIENKYESDPNITKRFIKEYENCKKKPSPHEIVSSIVMAEEFGKIIDELGGELELAVRMIIGCPYIFRVMDDPKVKHENGIKNCLIRLLNSSTIDVDKLDYITRDTKMTGYDNIMIDTERLLKSVTGIVYKQDDLYPAYRKTALSVVENVVAAKDSLNNWIIGHHAVVYEAYLIQAGIWAVADRISKEMIASGVHISKDDIIEKIFSIEAIKGCVEIGKRKICFLSDDDIWSLFKEYSDIGVIKELLDRRERKHPIWKSFAEFNYLLRPDKDDGAFDNFYKSFRILINAVDTDIEKVVNSALEEKLLKRYGDDDEKMSALWMLKKFVGDNPDDLEFVLLKCRKEEKKQINNGDLFIRFGSEKGFVPFNTVIGRASDETGSGGVFDFFYLFHKKRIDRHAFAKEVNAIYSPSPSP